MPNSNCMNLNQGSSPSALQEASLWNWQTRQTGPVSRWVEVSDENFQPDQIKCSGAHQEKGNVGIFLRHYLSCHDFLLSSGLLTALKFSQRSAFFALSPGRSPLSTHPIQYSPAFQVKENKEKERLERRLLDELYKIFMDSDSFYYSLTYDLTNSVQRQGDQDKSNTPLWKQVRNTNYWWFSVLLSSKILENTFNPINNNCYLKVDDRFFWNKHMIQDLIDLQVNHFNGHCLVLLSFLSE